MPPSEDELIAAAQAGDRAAIGSLLLSNYGVLADFVTSRLPAAYASSLSVDDILQETFSVTFRDIGMLERRSETGFSSWLKMIGEHRIRDAIRKLNSQKRGRGPQRLTKAGPAAEESTAELIYFVSADDPTVGELLDRDGGIQALRIALTSLPQHYQLVIQLRYFDGLSTEDTAEQMEQSPAAIASLADRAKVKLRAALGRISRYSLG